MKKLIALLILFGISTGYCATNQPTSVGSIKVNKLVLDTSTKAQINALTPDTTGQIVGCSDCTQSAICISTSVVVGGWVVPVSTGTFVGSLWSGFTHCQ